MKKGLLLALAHCLLALSIGAKFEYDRQTLPRAWVRTLPYDPDLPLRGRYVRMFLELDTDQESQFVRLSVRGDRLVATTVPLGQGLLTRAITGRRALASPVAFFIPAGIPDPSRRAPGEELWVEVSVPGNGLPRPIRLGVKQDGALAPLEIP
jgi:hypothetical protein